MKRKAGKKRVKHGKESDWFLSKRISYIHIYMYRAYVAYLDRWPY
jgi:hypothetical protein